MAFFRISKHKFLEVDFFKLWQSTKNSVIVHNTHLEVDNFFNKNQYFGFYYHWVLFGLSVISIKLYDTRYLDGTNDTDREELEPLWISSDAIQLKEHLTPSMVENFLVNSEYKSGESTLQPNQERWIYWTFPSITNPLWSKVFIQYKNESGEYFIEER